MLCFINLYNLIRINCISSLSELFPLLDTTSSYIGILSLNGCNSFIVEGCHLAKVPLDAMTIVAAEVHNSVVTPLLHYTKVQLGCRLWTA